MNRVTIFMPVSRPDYLDRIFAALELMDCDQRYVNLLVVVDGTPQLFVDTRNKVEMSKFAERLCVQFKSKHKLRHFDSLGRRMRISDIHNFAKEHIQDCEYVFGIEDDTVVPTNALEKLLRNYGQYPYAGFIQGIEIGRWGIPYIGAWKVDDIYDPQLIESTPLKKGLQEVDSGGFYCFMTKREHYVNHMFKPFGNNDLGPDVDYGLELRRLGLINYSDYDIKCAHKNKYKGEEKELNFSNTELRIARFIKKDGRWRQSNSGA